MTTKGLIPKITAVLVLGAALSLGAAASANASSFCAGGEPSYCARQDFGSTYAPSETSAPSAFYGAIGAGKIIIGPYFGERILRLTDALTINLSDVSNMYFDGNAGGSNENTPFSANDDFIAVSDNGGNVDLFSFDPTDMIANRLYVPSYPSTNGMKISGGGSFYAFAWNPALDDEMYFYGAPSDVELEKYDFTSLTTPPGPTVVKDLSADSNCGIGSGSVGWASDLTISDDGQTFALSISTAGGQGTASVATVYNLTSGCRYYNLVTGAIGGAWGASGTTTSPVRMYIHNLRLSGNGQFLRIDYAGCVSGPCSGAQSTLIWNIPTTTVVDCGDSGEGDYCAGHLANGYTHMINQSSDGGDNFTFSIRPLAGPSKPWNNLLVNLPNGAVDTHVAWLNANPEDTEPVLLSGDWGGPDFYPWTDEIFAQATNFSNKSWRFARTWVTGQSPYFNVAHEIGQVSRDGKFFLVSSDWGGHLGNQNSFFISSWSRTSNVVTVTATATIGGIAPGDALQIYQASTGTGGTSINGNWTVASVSGSTITFNQSAANDSSTTATGYIFDNTCSETSDCRGDAFVVELK